jgi:xylulokinase
MYLGIDCGTQGTKALLVGGNGIVHGRGYAPHALVERDSGAREQEPQWWVDATTVAVRQAVGERGRDVLALSVSGQQHGLVVLDEHKQVIRPAKLWNDTETASQNAALVAQFGGQNEVIRRFGILPLTGYTVSKLLWLKEREPENFSRIRHILLPHDYLNFWLTGELAAESGDASGTAFFDPRSLSWSCEILDSIDGGTGQLAAALPPLLRPEDIVGTVRPEVADALRLSRQCEVAIGGGDNMMGAIGTGNIREGIVTMSLGTSSTVYSYRNTSSADATGNVAPFCSSSGGWLPLVCTMNATNVLMQTLEVLGRTVDDIDPALGATVPGAGGLVFLPFLNGERTPDLPTAQGSIFGLRATNYTPDNLIRSVIEGVTFGILNGLDLILQGKSVDRIVIIGGGARSKEWRQLIADATGATLLLPCEDEAGCLGAAIQAMYARGYRMGQPRSYEELTNKIVRIDDGKTILPRVGQRAAMDAARQVYNRHLTTLYPEQARAMLIHAMGT